VRIQTARVHIPLSFFHAQEKGVCVICAAAGVRDVMVRPAEERQIKHWRFESMMSCILHW
jgi:hypothetical protein